MSKYFRKQGNKKKTTNFRDQKGGKKFTYILKGAHAMLCFWSNLGKDLNECFRSHVQHS